MLSASIRAVFFDAVGTLIHPAEPPARTYAAAAARRGIRLDEAEVDRRFRAAFRAEEDRDREAGWVTSEAREVERWRSIVTATLGGERCFPELWDHYANPSAWIVDVRAAGVLRVLRDRGITVGLASNLDGRLDPVVAGLPELDPVCSRVVVSSRVGARKPHRDFFAVVARVADTTPDGIAFVGDDPVNDFDGATAAGIQAVLVDPKSRYADRAPRIASISDLF